MSKPVFDVESEALKLPLEARVRLLQKLMSSIHTTPDATKSWAEVALERREAGIARRVRMVPGEGVVARVRAKYS